MKFNNIFFDLDGTLIDSKERLYRLFADLTKDCGIGFEEYWKYKMAQVSNEWILENQLGASVQDIDHFKKQWMAKIEEPYYLNMDKLFPDTIKVLDGLFGKTSMYVITARQHITRAIKQLENFGLAGYFKAALITEQKKTKTELIRSLNLDLNNSIILGDTGLETVIGKELGITTANVLTGFRNKEVLQSYNPDHIFSNLTEFESSLK